MIFAFMRRPKGCGKIPAQASQKSLAGHGGGLPVKVFHRKPPVVSCKKSISRIRRIEIRRRLRDSLRP
jgi:hypothetical protein